MDLIKFGEYIGRLKGLNRTGWIRYGVPNPESVAEHSFRTTIFAMVLSKEYGQDQLKAIKLALIDDIGEAIIGDVVAEKGGKVNNTVLKRKLFQERKALQRIFSLVGYNEAVSLFDELETNTTAEAKLVRQIDRLEMVLQAKEYEDKYKLDLEEFYQSGFARIKDKKLIKILEKLYSAHQKR